MSKQQIGVIGLAVMGKNLALNIESRGFSVSVYNRSSSKTEEFLQEAKGKNVVGTYSIEEFVQSLETPRKILLMVKAGTATDATIQSLLPHLEKDDILIDGGNTYYKDTQRRNKELAESGIHFIGTGVSGGEEGALKGPSIMPGGQKEAHELVKPILEAISAKVDGEPCTTYIGPDGAGHYVKMVHNGIEYGDMQLISLIKVVTIIAFLIVGFAFIFGFAPGSEPVGFSNLTGKGGFFPEGISSVLLGIVVVIFSFMGTEIVAIAAGETSNPIESVTKATRSVVWRIIVFYVAQSPLSWRFCHGIQQIF